MGMVAVANIVGDGELPRLPDPWLPGERLAGGGSGETYTAVDRLTGDACVVKVFAAAERSRRGALAELRSLTALAHPSIVRLRDLGQISQAEYEARIADLD